MDNQPFFLKTIRMLLSMCQRAFIAFCCSLYSNERIMHPLEHTIREAKLFRLKKSLKYCGSQLNVQFPVTITGSHMVELGDNVSLAAYVHIWGGGGVKIGSRVMIGTHTSITSLTHDYYKEVMYNTLIRKPVVIGDDVWIGSNCVILPGVTIGQGSVIGAGSVVTKDVQPRTVGFGIPLESKRER